jgi:hypothetical protein
MINGRYAIGKTIALVASLSMTLFVSYSAILSTVAVIKLNLCYSANNIENPYAEDCCYDEDESCLGCCFREIPPQNKNSLFFVSLDNGSYRNNVCDLQMLLPNSPVLAELYGITSEERFIQKDIIYFIFKPPQV